MRTTSLNTCMLIEARPQRPPGEEFLTMEAVMTRSKKNLGISEVVRRGVRGVCMSGGTTSRGWGNDCVDRGEGGDRYTPYRLPGISVYLVCLRSWGGH